MFAHRIIPIGLMLLLGGIPVLRSQALAVEAGSRVRLHTVASSRSLEGTVLRITGDSLILGAATDRSGPLAISLNTVRALEVWRGTRSAWRTGAEIGSFAGFVGASVAFAARMSHCVRGQCNTIGFWIPYAEAGSLAGAAVGGLAGAAFSQDRWERVPIGPVRPQVVVMGGRVGMGLSVQF
jgi:hypothetical protein